MSGRSVYTDADAEAYVRNTCRGYLVMDERMEREVVGEAKEEAGETGGWARRTAEHCRVRARP